MLQRGAAPECLVMATSFCMASPEDGIRNPASFSHLLVPIQFAHGERHTLRYCGCGWLDRGSMPLT